MRPLRTQSSTATTAGTNRFNLGLPIGQRLRTIRVVNETKGWTAISVGLVKRGDVTSGLSVGLINREIQPGNSDIGWDGDIIVTSDYPDVSAEFLNADADDVLVITVGVENV